MYYQLLNGTLEPTEDSDSDTSCLREGLNEHDNIVIYKSKLQQSEDLCDGLKDELSKFKNDCMQLQGAKVKIVIICFI